MSCLLIMSKSLLGKPGFFFQQTGGKLSYIISRRLHWMVQWAGARVAVTTVWLNFKQPVGRNHWPSCWHGSYGIIYNPPQSPQPSVDTHRAINTNDIQVMPVYITVKYGESQANSSSRLETRGLQWYGSAKLAGFNEFKNSGSLEGKITRSRRLPPYW